ncbi:MAG: hypothetical protein DMG25_04345 [Acidobacteria bacterium]|nr:MAG: hypothetical protein DMG25_04345 [Acidobacteriota bacterium]
MRKILWLIPSICCLVGWWGSIVGPRKLVAFGVVGFLGGGLLSYWAGKGPRVGAGLGRNWVILTVAQVALVLVAIACLIGMFASSRGGGVADSPALEVRAKYELMSHGHRAEVSRTRYVIASASFSTGWHALALLANVGALKRRFAS